MPRFKIIISFPDGEGENLEKFIFTSEERLTNHIIPLYEEEMGLKILEAKEVPPIYDQQVLEAQLDSGDSVELRNFSFHLTYAGLIEGDPDKEFNKSILEELQTRFRPDYIPTHIRRPRENRIKYELPVFYGKAEWVRHKSSTSETGSSSELRVIWFMDSVLEGLSFRQMLQESLSGLDWDQVAQRYDPGSL